MVRVWTVDALLVPVGLLAVAHADRLLATLAALLGVVAVLGLVTRDRNRRLVEAMDRLEQLERERTRVRVSIARLSRSLGATLDRRTILEAVLGAALDALAAPGGRAVLSGSGLVHEESGDAARALIAEAEAAAGSTHAPARVEAGGWVALAHPLRTDHDAGSLTVAAPADRVSADDDRMLGYLAAQAEAALRMIELHDRLRSQATVDELTGLANHRRFQEVLGKAIAQARRTELPLSLVLIDVDNFKQVNDTHGHQCGDEVLRAIGAVLRERSRASDTPARYGGEELAVIMPGADAAGACSSAEALRDAMRGLEISGPNGPVRVTASFGVCELGPAANDAAALVGAADAALYAAKRSGKDRVVDACAMAATGG
jgi:diguanylate cyclase (GGDEF)-like protein